MDERLRFVGRLLDGETMTALYVEFGISRKTGYKIFERYEDFGAHALTDRSRRPYRQVNKLPDAVEQWILRLKRRRSGLLRRRDRRLEPTPNPFGPAVSPMSSG